MIFISEKRIHTILGHLGSGKSEFAINYAIYLNKYYDKVALCDLDIINMYFRSREKKEMLNKEGIEVFSSSRLENDTLDVPALDSRILTPLQNKDYEVILDVGGDPKGALILRTYKDYLDDSENIFVINKNRMETSDLERSLSYIKEIESFSGIKVTKIVNTTNMLKETSVDDIIEGHILCERIAKHLDIEFLYDVCISSLKDEILNDKNISSDIKKKLFPIKLYLREDRMS